MKTKSYLLIFLLTTQTVLSAYDAKELFFRPINSQTSVLFQEMTEGNSDVRLDSDSDKVFPLPQMVITATRTSQNSFEIPREIVTVQQEQFEKRATRFTPDALSESPSITVQKTNYGAGAPIIRGMIGNQVLLLVDGIRLNNSTFRFGPNQYLNTVSPFLIDRIEIVEGPGSVLFGSDALGGTVNLITRDIKNQSVSGVRLLTTLSTADQSGVSRLDYTTHVGNISMNLGGGYRKHEDLRSGQGVQPATGFSGYEGDVKLRYSVNEQDELNASYQFTQYEDVPRTDKIASGDDKKYMFNPQRRELSYLSYDAYGITEFVQLMRVTLSYNRQVEGREEITTKKPTMETRDMDEIQTVGASVELHSSLNEQNLLTYGLEWYSDYVSSRRDTVNLATNFSGSVKSQFPDGTRYRTFGAFLQNQFSYNPFSVIAGVRYSAFKFQGTLGVPFGETVSTPSDVTFSLNGLYKVVENHLNFIAGISQGFRAPNVDDIAVFGKSGSGAGARFDTPSPELHPEKSINIESGLKYQDEKSNATLFFYTSNYTDLIVPKPGIYNGDDSLSGLRVYQRQNVGEAKIQGINFSGRYRLTPTLSLRSELSWTEGTNTSDNEPLSRIPPFRGIIGLTFQEEKYWFEYQNLFATEQTHLSTNDKKDFRIGPNGTAGYWIVNLRGGYSFSEQLSANMMLENVLDRHYKIHGSGVYSPGRNVILSLKIGL
ncbi:MAG: TonB-dependent receptor [Ignavibacteriae bacterium]|nr:TonB-dependent receptor [Ignavibacteriota bacterium]